MSTPESEKLALISAQFITRRRLARDAQNVLSLFFLVVIVWDAAAHRSGVEAFLLIALYIALGVSTRWTVRALIQKAMPPHLRSRLPDGPLDAKDTLGAPHTYLDVLKIWSTPSFACTHQPDLHVPSSAPRLMKIGPAIALYLVAALAICLEAAAVSDPVPPSLKLSLASTVAATAITAQLALTFLWRSKLRERKYQLPTAVEIWITCFVAAAATLAALAVAWRAA